MCLLRWTMASRFQVPCRRCARAICSRPPAMSRILKMRDFLADGLTKSCGNRKYCQISPSRRERRRAMRGHESVSLGGCHCMAMKRSTGSGAFGRVTPDCILYFVRKAALIVPPRYRATSSIGELGCCTPPSSSSTLASTPSLWNNGRA
jgi:hypothetical protein